MRSLDGFHMHEPLVFPIKRLMIVLKPTCRIHTPMTLVLELGFT
jgi:hypothetical protein